MSTETTIASPKAEAQEIVNKYVPWSMGAGFVPVPLVDVAALTGVQLKMIAEISAAYGIKFSENRGKSILLSLLGGAGSTTLALGTLGSLVKSIPGLGTWLGAGTLPVIGGAATFAVGKVFIQHFESGGTFLNFDSMAAKQQFSDALKEGMDDLKSTAKKVDSKISSTLDI